MRQLIHKHPKLLLTLALFSWFFMILFTCQFGYQDLSFAALFKTLAAALGFSFPSEQTETLAVIVFDVRLPRILCALLLGATLAVSGTLFQAVLHNPLADPYTLGVSAGAAFGASLAILFFPSLSTYVVPLAAFAGATLSLVWVMAMVTTRGAQPLQRFASTSIILSGIIVTSILSAAISLLKFLADEKVAAIIFWLMGSLAASGWSQVLLALLGAFLATGCGLLFVKELNLLVLGEREAASLGVKTTHTLVIVLVAATLATGIAVATAGIIGFIGLLVPHLLRWVVGPDHRTLIPASFFAGGLLLLGADTLTRSLFISEVPIGVLTAILGGPVFCYIFRKAEFGAHKG
jgi:iron complex transport system permease protein